MSIQIRADGILDPDGKYPNPLTGQPYSKRYKIFSTTQPGSEKKGWRELSSWKSRMKILAKIHKSSILLLKLPPGTGKTVIIPKLLLHYFGYQKRVICTVPKQVAASSAANFASICLDVPIYQPDEKGGDTKILTNYKMIGYKYQGTLTKFYEPQKTILLFTTDGSVEAMILGGDINLANYGGIIIDEAHERSVTIDIVIALVMDIIPRRPDFKIIIMSATIDMQFFEDYFIRIGQGKNYSVFDLPNEPSTAKLDYVNSPPKNNISTKLEEVVYKKLEEIILDPHLPNGDILAFVTSNTDIDKIKQLLTRNMSKFPVNNKPYFIGFSSNISDDDKKIATDKGSLKTIPISKDAPQGYSRKVIIGTNAVESSITFGDPLVYVIESGFAFEVKYNAKNYCIDTGKVLVSQASITQRCGRTGRTNDGTCIQLYSKEQFKKLPEWTEPKIRMEDFTPTLLSIINLPNNGNLQKALEFINTRMIEPVKNYKDFIIRAYENLLNMGIIDTSGNLTSLGYVCSRFNMLDLKIVKMVIGGYYLGCLDMCVMLGAILTNTRGYEDFFVKPFDILKNPKAKQQYENNIKRFIHKSGDHITLLKIFYDFYMNPDKYKYTSENGLNYKTLSSIQKNYSDLVTHVTRNAQLIKALNLFSVPPEVLVFGGGKGESNNSNNINNMFKGNDSETDDSDESISDDSETDDSDKSINDDETDDSDSDDSYDSETEEIEFENNFTLHNKEEDIAINDTNPIYGGYNKGSIQHIKNDINLSDKNIGKHRKLSIKNIKGNKSKKLSTKYGKEKGKGKRKGKGKGNNTETKITLMSGGDQKHDKTIVDKVLNRRVKILNLVELGNLQPRVMMPPIQPIDRVLAALYYGFSINRACYSGSGKQYIVKSSPLKGSIGKTTFDYIEKMPDFIVYTSFTVMKSPGREDANLALVSEIGSKELGQFLNLHEILKKIS